MATGSGKTLVMAMLIAWQGLNKLANPDDKRFSSNFLVVTPGIAIRDRLRVLPPEDPTNYYQALDIISADLRESLGQLHIVVTNYHAFQLREKLEASKLTKEILKKRASSDAELDKLPSARINQGKQKFVVIQPLRA